MLKKYKNLSDKYKWIEYERLKKEVKKLNLNPIDYYKEIRKISDNLGL